METVDLLRALQAVEKRAERTADDAQVLETYVAVGPLVSALRASDNGIVYGRRGTGKTHALRYLAESERAARNFVLYIDVDTMLGSTEGIYSDTRLSLAERATRLLVDVLGLIHTALLEDAFSGKHGDLINPLEKILDHFGEVIVATEVSAERTTGHEAEATRSSGMSASLSPRGLAI